jgi:transmembrane protein TMEM254
MSTATSIPVVDPETFIPVAPRWWFSNFGGMVLFWMFSRRSKSRWMRRGFALAALLHIGESLYSYDKARRAGFHTSANRWALQTLAVGFPSLGALNEAIEAAHLAATSGDDLAA